MNYQKPTELAHCLNYHEKFVKQLIDEGHTIVSVPGMMFFIKINPDWEYRGCAGNPVNFFLTERDVEFMMNGVD